LIKALGILGSLQTSAGQTDEALENGIKALDLAKLINDSISIGQELSKVAGLHYKLGNSVIAKEMFFEAIEINNQTGNKLNQYYAYSNLSTVYQGALNFDSMIWATKKSLEYLDTNARPANYTTGLGKLAQGYIEKKEYEQVLPMLQHGLAYAQRKGLTKSIVTFYRLYGYYYREIKDFKKAEAYYQKGIKIIDSTGLFFPKRYYYESLSYVYEQLGDYKNAYTYERLFNEHKDSIYKIEKVKAISEAEAKYYDEKKELELSILKKDNIIKDKKAARQKAIFIGLFAFIILLGLVSFLGLRSYKLKQRLRIEKFRNKVAADLHDDVGSTLSSIAMYSEVIKSKTKDVLPETVPMLENMTNSSSQLMEAMSDIVWTINPKNNTFQSLLQRIREFAGELCEAKGIDFKFTQKGEIVNLKLNMDASQNLYLVMKEAINNALKYSQCTELELKVQKEQKELSFSVSDNGIGFDTENPNIGNGVTNMKDRIEEIDGKISIKSSSEGSIIKGVLPV
jgi:two-component system, NarL family, sensor histidine kinase UhpB